MTTFRLVIESLLAVIIMRHNTLFTILILMLFAVAANAQNGYQAAKEKVKIGGKQIVVKSEVYLNRMPQAMVLNPNLNLDCSKSGSLIAPVTIESANGSTFPKGIEIKQIWIKNNNLWLKFRFNKDETNVKESSIFSVGRECPNDKFDDEQTVIIVVELKYKSKSYFVRSNQTKIEKVF